MNIKKEIKKAILCILVFGCCASLSAQVFNVNSQYQAFDTNGPVGDCLFPSDDIMQEVVEVDSSKDEIRDAITSWANQIAVASNNRAKVNHFESTERQITFDMQLYLGSTTVDIPWVGLVEKQYSEVKYNCLIEIKDNKYRISFSKFLTDRVTIRGEAKSNGPSNMIHWQRVNSLTKERNKVIGNRSKLSSKKQKEVDEYNNRINQEENIYQIEWSTVCEMMNQLKSCTKEVDF